MNTRTQLEEYFEGRRKQFDLPLRVEGTDFQKKVWSKLKRIPYGKLETYGSVAKSLGKPLASRAVGGANNKNKIGIIIPCHRVVGTSGSLTGYAPGLKYKEFLLKLEGSLENCRIIFFRRFHLDRLNHHHRVVASLDKFS